MNLRRRVVLFSLLAASATWSLPFGEAAAQRPEKQIPPTVLLEVRDLEQRFDNALLADCSAERCFSKGCTYRQHIVLDTPRDSSLPGLPQEAGPGSVAAQEYLTSARCDFAYEDTVESADVVALSKRLERRLSKGWLRVRVGHEKLTPISAELGQAPPKATPAPDAATLPGTEWTGGAALRELWTTLLPHFSWMIAVLLATLAILTVIWALRRLGRESIEEKLMLSELENGNGLALGSPDDAVTAEEPPPDDEGSGNVEDRRTPDEQDAAYVSEQTRLWSDRIAQAELETDDSVVMQLLQQWLKAGEFALLLKAVRVFGDKLSLSFPSTGELAARKVEFAEYVRRTDGRGLPSDAEFFRTLDHHAISSKLLSQPDADVYRSIREDFGSTGVANLIGALPPRHGALLFAMVARDIQHEVTQSLAPESQAALAGTLLNSNRVPPEDRAYLFAALDSVRIGRPLPAPPAAVPDAIVDLGHEFDAPGALSVVFTHMEGPARQALFHASLERRNGSIPAWYANILYPDMLLQLSDEARSDLLLEVDVKALAGWCSMYDARWQEAFLGSLNPAIEKAVRANMNFTSRADQLRLAQRGQRELVDGLKRARSLGKANFMELVA